MPSAPARHRPDAAGALPAARAGSAPPPDTVDVILRDGTTLRLRPPGASDADALVAFFARLSDESRYRRFHGAVVARRVLVEPFLEPDWNARGVLVGTLAHRGRERVVAVGDYARLRDPAVAEVALAVADELQGTGIGTRLLEQLAARAVGVGVHRFLAEVMSDNERMLRVFADAGFASRRSFAGGVVEVELQIVESASYLERVDERDRTAVERSLLPLLRPSTVAVVGASPRRGVIGGELFRNLIAAEFTGTAYAVNRRGEPVAGIRAFARVSELPEPVDLAVICVPAAAVLAAAEDALGAGARVLCVVSAGFAETGKEGAARQAELLSRVRAHGARLVGPNCLGVAAADVRLNATFGRRPPLAGNVGFSSQSGALGLAVLEHAHERGLGLSAFVSLGNKADVSSNDLLDYWEADPATDVILIYVESFGNPRRFARVASRVARRKPILAMKSGTSAEGARAAASHTAALAGSDAAVDALFEHAGVLRANTLEEFLDGASLLASQPLPAGNRVAIVTNAGGLGILCADASVGAGLQLAAPSASTVAGLRVLLPPEASLGNPIDMLGSASDESYRAALQLVLADQGVDAVIALFVPTVVARCADVASAIQCAIESAESPRKPVLSVLVDGDADRPRAGVDAPGAASFRYPESAARALGLAARRATWLRRPEGRIPDLAGIDRAAADEIVSSALADVDETWLDAAASARLLIAYGIPLVPEQLAATPAAAADAASRLGYPVVVKSAVAGSHKTETGGVALDLRNPASVRSAAAHIGGCVLVQRMLAGAEFLAGVVQDPVFGPLVAFGAGGVLTELIGDAGFRLAPLTDVDASELIHHGAAGRLAAGARGAAAIDASALTDLLHRLSALAQDQPALAELDLNPVIASGDEVAAADRRIRLRRPVPSALTKTW